MDTVKYSYLNRVYSCVHQVRALEVKKRMCVCDGGSLNVPQVVEKWKRAGE